MWINILRFLMLFLIVLKDDFVRRTNSGDTKLYFCTKEDQSGCSGDWPKGNYCIMRKGYPCPEGFVEGYAYWDKEDYTNTDSKSDTLQDGKLTSRIIFFPRNYSSTDISINFPTAKPFYLVRYRLLPGLSPCQHIKGMHFTETIVKTYDEHYRDTNRVYGSPPMHTGITDHTLYFCYYYKKL